MQAVEEKRLDRQFGTHCIDVESAAEAAHGDLEGVRASRGVEGDGFAVEHQGMRGEGAHRLDDFGYGGGHFVQ